MLPSPRWPKRHAAECPAPARSQASVARRISSGPTFDTPANPTTSFLDRGASARFSAPRNAPRRQFPQRRAPPGRRFSAITASTTSPAFPSPPPRSSSSEPRRIGALNGRRSASLDQGHSTVPASATRQRGAGDVAQPPALSPAPRHVFVGPGSAAASCCCSRLNNSKRRLGRGDCAERHRNLSRGPRIKASVPRRGDDAERAPRCRRRTAGAGSSRCWFLCGSPAQPVPTPAHRAIRLRARARGPAPRLP